VLVFLHPVESAGHVVHPGASGPRNVEAVFFVVGWVHCGFYKMCVGTSYAELVLLHTKCVRTRHAELVIFHLVGSAGHVVHSNVSDA
jgi:hypothetical protein